MTQTLAVSAVSQLTKLKSLLDLQAKDVTHLQDGTEALLEGANEYRDTNTISEGTCLNFL